MTPSLSASFTILPSSLSSFKVILFNLRLCFFLWLLVKCDSSRGVPSSSVSVDSKALSIGIAIGDDKDDDDIIEEVDDVDEEEEDDGIVGESSLHARRKVR